MRWSLTIGRIFGITLRLHVTFLLLLGLIGYSGFVEAGASGAVWSVSMVSSIFACIALHELGHSVVAQRLGVQVKSITLLPIGGVAALKRIPENPWHEIAITLAGPMVNAVIAAALLPFTGLPSRFFLVGMPSDISGLMLAIVQANIALFVFNFIPAFPMDGGRLLRATLALMFSYRRATVVAATVGQGLAIVFILFGMRLWGVWPGALWLIIIGAFIFFGAEGEEKMVRMRTILREIDVDEVMSRDFAVLSPRDTVARGLELVYQTGQDDFPVLQDNQLVGVVTRQAMLAAVNTSDPAVPVAEVMNTDVPMVSPQDKVTRVYEEMLSEGPATFPVMQDGQLLGILSPENISRYLLVQTSIKSKGRRRKARSPGFARIPAPPPVIGGVPPVAAPRSREESSRS